MASFGNMESQDSIKRNRKPAKNTHRKFKRISKEDLIQSNINDMINKLGNSVDEATNNLEALKDYESIGSVEDLRECVEIHNILFDDNKEKMSKFIKDDEDIYEALTDTIEKVEYDNKELNEYRKFGTIEELLKIRRLINWLFSKENEVKFYENFLEKNNLVEEFKKLTISEFDEEIFKMLEENKS